jgi:hypothetical protein
MVYSLRILPARKRHRSICAKRAGPGQGQADRYSREWSWRRRFVADPMEGIFSGIRRRNSCRRGALVGRTCIFIYDLCMIPI